MSESYDAANLEAMSVAEAYQSAMLRLARQKLNLSQPFQRVIDFGAGRGDYAAALTRVTGSEVLSFEPDTRLHAHYLPTLKVVADLTAIPAGYAEKAYSLNVLEHITDDAAALRTWATRCQAGAYIFLLVPANPGLWTPMDTLVGHQRRYAPATLANTVREAGLVVEESGWFDRTGYFATRAYQVLSLLRTKETAGAVSKGQMRLFDALFSLSEPVFSGLRLPFGKNCWVLAKKPA